ncbi:hypothetical protein C8T65DRAFT_583417, partial [Cerioporus squamosus]
PRSLFSESELRVSRWYAMKTGSQNLPSIKSVKEFRKKLVAMAGTNPQSHKGNCGHLYTMSDMSTIYRHEWANPVARARLQVYAEESGERLAECRQARRWRHEVNANLAAPMARSATGKDYFVEEIAVVDVPGRGLAPVMISRWFMKDSQLLATVLPLRVSLDGGRYVIDARTGQQFDIPLEAFRLSVLDLEDNPTVLDALQLPRCGDIEGACQH